MAAIFYEHFYANKFYNLDEMDKCLKIYTSDDSLLNIE